MRRSIEWKERTDEGDKRVVRVTYFAGTIKWQFQVNGNDWDYNTPPSVEDWEHLVTEVENRYNRKRVPIKDLELAQKHLDLARKKQQQQSL